MLYNFGVEDIHNYHVSEGILVHNNCFEWLNKARSLNVIKNGCEVVTDRVVGTLGKGAEYLQITPRLGFEGEVQGKYSGWRWHFAAIKDGRVFDRLTGKAGMLVKDYIKLFDNHPFISFEKTAVRTIK